MDGKYFDFCHNFDNSKIKIVAMHHHLIGIPDTGTDNIIIVDASHKHISSLDISKDRESGTWAHCKLHMQVQHHQHDTEVF